MTNAWNEVSLGGCQRGLSECWADGRQFQQQFGVVAGFPCALDHGGIAAEFTLA